METQKGIVQYLASKNSNNLGLKYDKLCSKSQYNVIKESKKI